MSQASQVVTSADGLPIHYEVQGNGTPALVCVHGWCCNRSYWDKQVRHFAPHHTVVTLDLAGHGASGRDRALWTIPAFGADVVAVVETLGLTRVILIGHSMGGPVIVEAARRLQTRVLGLVGVDTFHDVEQHRTQAQVDERMAPFHANFGAAAQQFVHTMFLPTSDATLRDSVLAAMTAAPPHIGIAALTAVTASDRLLREGLQELHVPIVAINSDAWRPTQVAAAQRHGLEVVLMSGVGHFVMLEDVETFNTLLEAAIRKCSGAR